MKFNYTEGGLGICVFAMETTGWSSPNRPSWIGNPHLYVDPVPARCYKHSFRAGGVGLSSRRTGGTILVRSAAKSALLNFCLTMEARSEPRQRWAGKNHAQ